ncbi:MAG: hypothetical protein P8Q26_12560 [Ascidiaceihabitans sp.]|nr:hypothetical protein [Ascidiaceihabitans sp.]
MNVLRKANTAVETSDLDMFSGDHVELFSTSSAPTCSDMISGDLSGSFSSGSAPTMGAKTDAGEGTQMFSSGS